MQAASRAGIAAIGYANRPVKTETLANTGADIIVESLQPILAALVEA